MKRETLNTQRIEREEVIYALNVQWFQVFAFLMSGNKLKFGRQGSRTPVPRELLTGSY
jgi:hypothetical protein